MKARKWNESRLDFEAYELPKGAVTFAQLGQPVPCARCGKLQDYGYCYTSVTIYDDLGFGYPVCSGCYKREFKEMWS